MSVHLSNVSYKFFHIAHSKFAREVTCGSQGGLVVIIRASHLCDPDSTLALGLMWAEFQSIST